MAASKRYSLIINPKSGSSATLDGIRRVRDYLHQQGHAVYVDLTQSLQHAGELAHQAVNTRCDVIIIAGGDGTVRAVADATTHSNVPITIVPAGTENLLATELGFDRHGLATVKALQGGKISNLDLGAADGQRFMAIAGIGFDAEVIHRIQQFRTGYITHVDYIWPIVRTFWEYQFPPLKVIADGQCVCDEPALVFISNISRYAVGLPINRNADWSDGLLDLTVFRMRQRRQLLFHSAATLLNCHHRRPSVTQIRSRRIQVSCATSTFVQLDGDPGPLLPLDIHVIPAAARILLPPPQPGQPFAHRVKWANLRNWMLR